jgi:hypothetical protein
MAAWRARQQFAARHAAHSASETTVERKCWNSACCIVKQIQHAECQLVVNQPHAGIQHVIFVFYNYYTTLLNGLRRTQTG